MARGPRGTLATTVSDDALLDAVSAGDADALRMLHDRHGPWMYRHAYRYTHDRTTAEEVVQDVLLAVWQSSARFNPAYAVDAWLFSILRHHAIGTRRSRLYRARAREHSLNAWPATEPALQLESPEPALVDQQLLRQVLHALPATQRETLGLGVAGWSVAAIAQSTGRPVGTVKAQRLRGFQQARALLVYADPIFEILPAFTLSIIGVANMALHTRQKLIDVLHSDYALFARAQGETTAGLVWQHGLRNVALPAITVQFASLSELFGGAVLAEQVFAYPGLGQATIEAALRSDVPLLLGIVFFSAIFVFVGNTLADVAYQVIDPRIRIGGTDV